MEINDSIIIQFYTGYLFLNETNMLSMNAEDGGLPSMYMDNLSKRCTQKDTQRFPRYCIYNSVQDKYQAYL